MPAASRDVWFVPDGFARAVQERGGNLAPQEFYGSSFATKLIGVVQGLSKNVRGITYCAELILWTSRTGD